MCPSGNKWAGIVPKIRCKGGMTIPAEEGPNNLTPALWAASFNINTSCRGMCSVVQIIKGIFSLIAASVSSGARPTVAKMILTSAPVFVAASLTVLYKGLTIFYIYYYLYISWLNRH